MSDNALEAACQDLIEAFQSRPTLRAGSLITTVFGDSIAPRGGVVWLGSLIEAMAGFGVSERLVRTSVFRLVKDGWLEAEQIGRRSFYSLTEEGSERRPICSACNQPSLTRRNTDVLTSRSLTPRPAIASIRLPSQTTPPRVAIESP